MLLNLVNLDNLENFVIFVNFDIFCHFCYFCGFDHLGNLVHFGDFGNFGNFGYFGFVCKFDNFGISDILIMLVILHFFINFQIFTCTLSYSYSSKNHIPIQPTIICSIAPVCCFSCILS